MCGDATGVFFGCHAAKVKLTGEIVRVRNINAFEPDLIPEWEQVGDNGMILQTFNHFDLEFDFYELKW